MATSTGMPVGMDGGGPSPPPGTDMTGICFRDQIWLNTFPLDRHFVFDYFALSPFYDFNCNNEHLRTQSIHPLDLSHLSKMTGIEFMLTEAMEPHLFVIRKQKRDGPEKVTPMLTYYILDGSIYQAPQLSSVFASRMVRALYYISKSFATASSKLEKIGYDTESDISKPETKPGGENIDIKEVKRVEHILAALQRKLPVAPPPPFPEGAVATSADNQTQDGQPAEEHSDPIFDQKGVKRSKTEK
eukprot:TRINITY_DN12770_c0_g1_i1.p1 TRINITY_DN12770_c0_g1~~TRINITY_DN12770_c0_g1_i1.p1  ORF type:complete len:244 (+),score=42.76 TRINITY_DN12770_c0_g1_i1:83-814(+)